MLKWYKRKSRTERKHLKQEIAVVLLGIVLTIGVGLHINREDSDVDYSSSENTECCKCNKVYDFIKYKM